MNELSQNAKDKIRTSISDDLVFIDESLVAEAKSKDFSNKVGDEANTLKLSMEVEAKGLAVKKETLNEFAKEILKNKVSSGFVLRDDQIEIGWEYEGEEDGNHEMVALVKANLLPEVKPDDIAKKIRGTYPSIAKQYLLEVSGFSRAEIKMVPNLPGKLGSLPRVADHIIVEVAADK